MKKLLLILLLSLIPLTSFAKLHIITTTPDLAALTRSVGQELVDVESLTRGDQDSHAIEPKPSYAAKLNRADLLIEVGLDLEVGWLPVLLLQARNPNIQTGKIGHLNASEGLSILEIPTGKIDRSEGDIHPYGNPHYWLDPHNGLMIAKKISERLSQIDPTHAQNYLQNEQQFEEQLKNKIALWEKQITSLKGIKLITYHNGFAYFAHWAGLQIEGFVEPKPGIPPNPSHILAMIELIKTKKIPLIITENYYNPKPSQELASKTGAKLLILPTSVEGEPALHTYEELFETLIKRIKESL